MANLELRGNYGLHTNTGIYDTACQRQMQAEQMMRELKEQEYNIMRTQHLEADLVAQEKQEEEEDIYYLLT